VLKKPFPTFSAQKRGFLLFSIFQSGYVIETGSAIGFLAPLDVDRFYSPSWMQAAEKPELFSHPTKANSDSTWMSCNCCTYRTVGALGMSRSICYL